MRIIEGEADVAEGALWLSETHPYFAQILPGITPLPLRLRPDGFGQLLGAIMGQQVSTASAAAIIAKLDAAGFLEEGAVARASEEELRACGLSRQKIRYAQELARARIDYAALREADSAAVVKTLTAVPGIGAWTAEIYAMFSLGHADVFAPGDLALQIAVQDMLGLEARPSEKQLRLIAQDWSPWRSVAARALFAYYRVIKGREGLA
jgi:DNA-3-methyladenine glycosylase II